VDPVIISSSGHRLLSERGVQTMLEELLPIATLITLEISRMSSSTDCSRGSCAICSKRKGRSA
jgi:hydroxymethylpyrimidine/phosphomethylpyrimidine kinase